MPVRFSIPNIPFSFSLYTNSDQLIARKFHNILHSTESLPQQCRLRSVGEVHSTHRERLNRGAGFAAGVSWWSLYSDKLTTPFSFTDRKTRQTNRARFFGFLVVAIGNCTVPMVLYILRQVSYRFTYRMVCTQTLPPLFTLRGLRSRTCLISRRTHNFSCMGAIDGPL